MKPPRHGSPPPRRPHPPAGPAAKPYPARNQAGKKYPAKAPSKNYPARDYPGRSDERRPDRERPRRPHERPQPPASTPSPAYNDRRPPRPEDSRRPFRPENADEMIFGLEPVRELVGVAPGAVRTLYVKAGIESRVAGEIAAVRTAGGQVASVPAEALVRMAGPESRHQGLVALMRPYQYAAFEEVLAARPEPLVVIDGVTDPRNLGAIMRSAECAGVRTLVIARDRTAAVTPAAVKASAGAWVHLRIARCGNVAQALEALKQAGYWIAALAPGGDTSLYQLDTTRQLAFVLGAEDRGVRELVRKRVDYLVNIPMYGQIGSLNVSVAAAVALFEVARRRTQARASEDAQGSK